MANRAHSMPFGADLLPHGGVRFCYWSPSVLEATLEIVDESEMLLECKPMQRGADGWHMVTLAEAAAGTLYRYRVAEGLAVPDPASRWNPLGVHGPSRVVDSHAHAWRNADWRGIPWHMAVVYELHIGTFTPKGTFDGATERLASLRELGITAIELMPVAQFGGERGWGYDGVLPFAPHAAYGTPDSLKRFVDAAHGLGLMVLLDVVYNHFGPEGNWLPAACPEFFDPASRTPWGAAINFGPERGETVRQFFIENALYWVEEFQFDGLRLDAVHAIQDRSPQHIVAAIAAALRSGPGRDRFVHLVLENDANQASLLRRDAQARPIVGTAQWNDDLHHAAHVLATREQDAYYAGYLDKPAALLGKALAEGFIYQGQGWATRSGAPRGEPSGALPSQAFVNFLQTHDQIGNRAFGERLDALADPARLEALLACVLLAPSVPMLFMGEEFAAGTPFLYFCDFHGELAQAVTAGRRAEFAAFPTFGDADVRDRIPDPNSAETFKASKLRSADAAAPAGVRRLALVRELLALRQRLLVPRLAGQRAGGRFETEGEAITVEWRLGDGSVWTLRANFGDLPMAVRRDPHDELVWRCNTDDADEDTTWLRRDGLMFVQRSAEVL